MCDFAEGVAETVAKFSSKMSENAYKTIAGLSKLGKRANPSYSNKVYASILAGRVAKYSETAARATELAGQISKLGKFFTAAAVTSDVVGGWTEDNSRPLDRKITDATVDGSFAYINVEVSAAVGVSLAIDKFSEVEIGGKSIKQHVKDGLYNAVEARGNTILKGMNTITSAFGW